LWPWLPAEVQAPLNRLGEDALTREQQLDFLTGRAFRQSLLGHAEVALHPEVRPERRASLWVASAARSSAPAVDLHSDRVDVFRGADGPSLSTGHPVSKAALACLAEAWPRWLPFAELLAAARARLAGDAVLIQDAATHDHDAQLLGENLLRGFAADLVELHVTASPYITELTERPRASTLARFQAAQGSWVTTRRHMSTSLDPLSCHLLRHLDGSRSRPALVEALVEAVQTNHLLVQRFGRPVTDTDHLRGILSRELEANLRRLAQLALLVA
jgi:methyltransferase-like protein